MMLRYSKLLGGIALALGCYSAAWAAQAEYPYPTPAQPCPPCAKKGCQVPPYGGYYQTTWRQWPGEDRLEIKNPRAVHSELLPTPQGQKEAIAPPKALPEAQPTLPGMPQEGELLPPGGDILPPEQSTVPMQPETPKPTAVPPVQKKEPQASPEPGVPGLPSEPNASPAGGKSSYNGRMLSPTATRVETRQPMPREAAAVQPANNNQVSRYAVQVTPHQAEPIGAVAPNVASPIAETAAYATVESEPADSLDEVGVPRVALGGYCPVELLHSGRWVTGDLRFTVVHNGWIYRLSGPKQWKEFSANPEAFTPACLGNDVVMAVEDRRDVSGQITCCAVYNGRLYLFASPETQAKFNQNPQRYAVGK